MRRSLPATLFLCTGLCLTAFVQAQDDWQALFPVEKGNKWIYETASDDVTATVTYFKKEKEKTKATIRFAGKGYSEDISYFIDNEGVQLTGRTVATESVAHKTTAPEGMIIIPFPPTEGREVAAKMKYGNTEIERKVQVKGEEELKVKGGEFKAQHILITVTEVAKKKVTEEEELWVAPEVGIVKRRVKGGDWGSKELTFELKDKTLKARPVPKPFDPVESVIPDLLLALDAELKEGNVYFAHALSILILNNSDDAQAQKNFDSTAAAIKEKPETPVKKASSGAEFLKSAAGKNIDTRNIKGEILVNMIQTAYDIADAHAGLNQFRKELGLQPVVLDAAASKRCYLHSRYLAKNGYTNPVFKTFRDYHTEDANNSFFTQDGAIAGASSVVAGHKPAQALKEWIETYYHRIPLMNPGLSAVGIGTWSSSVDSSTPSCMDIISCIDRKEYGKPLLYPYPEQKNVKPRFNEYNEMPEPVPSVKSSTLGTAITICWFRNAEISLVESSVRCDGKEIEHYVSSPDKPSNSEEHGWSKRTICLMAKKHLPAKSKIKISVKCKVDGAEQKFEFEFETGE